MLPRTARPSITTRPGLVGPVGSEPMMASGNSNDQDTLSAWSGGQAGSLQLTPHSSLPYPPDVAPRPLSTRESQLIDHLVRLQLFLATAPSSWQQHGSVPSGPMYPGVGDWSTNFSSSADPSSFISSPHPALNRFLLPNGEHVCCVYWNGLYQITGTDIVRALAFRFEAFGRPVKTSMVKKFEEGVFSDLRNLKPGEDSSLEKPKSEFLDMLFKYGCIRTQKKQKVFFWFSVPHDRLFLDALERDLKREKDGQAPTTEVVGEPARSFRWDPSLSLFEQFASPDLDHMANPESELDVALPEGSQHGRLDSLIPSPNGGPSVPQEPLPQLPLPSGLDRRREPYSVSLFEGSPGYKQRKRRGHKDRQRHSINGGGSDMDDESGSEADMVSTEAYPSRMTPMAYSNGPSQSYPYPGMPTYPQDRYGSASGYSVPPGYRTDSDMHMGSQPSPYGVPMPRPMSQNFGGPAPGLPAPVAQYPPIQQPPQWSAQQLFPQSAAYGLINSFPPAPLGSTSTAPVPLGGPVRFPSQQPASSSDNEVEPSERGVSDGESSSDINSRMFRCPLDTCSRLFKRLEHLKRHVRTHTQERPYLCSKCSKRFSRSDNLTQHLKTHEKNDPKPDSLGAAGSQGGMPALSQGAQPENAGPSVAGPPYAGAGVQRISKSGPSRQTFTPDPGMQRSASRTDNHLMPPTHLSPQTHMLQRLGTASPQPTDFVGGSSPHLARSSLGGTNNRFAPYARSSMESHNGNFAGSQAGGSPSLHGSPYPAQPPQMGSPAMYNGGIDAEMGSVNPASLSGPSQTFQPQAQPTFFASNALAVDPSLSTNEADLQIPLQTPATGAVFEGMLNTAAMTDGGGTGWPSRDESLTLEE